MDTYVFNDALADCKVTCGYPGLETHIVGEAEYDQQPKSVFFPGCSFLNYALPLVKSVQDLLADAGKIDGISLLCCGKILAYEPDGERVRAEFEERFRQEVAARGIEKFICACPNCVLAMRTLLAESEETARVEVLTLPQVLADLGYRIDPDAAQSVFENEWNDGFLAGYQAFAEFEEGAPAPKAVFSVKDSCPDRQYGDFADGVRRLMPEGRWVEPEHNRSRSVCCGSLPRAAGKFEAADKSAQINGNEAVEAQATAIVTPCVSCCFQLSLAQFQVPVYHYLELLYSWRIPWAYTSQYMKLRFLFDTNLGVDSDNRSFMGLAE